MITDIFIKRNTEFDPREINSSFFVQLFNLYDDHDLGIHGALLDKFNEYAYSIFANEHIRIIAQTQKKICSELGYQSLDKPQRYLQPDWDYDAYRVFKNYVFDESINQTEKLSFFEVLFRDAEQHLLSEIDFLKTHIPKYEERSLEIKQLSKSKAVNYYNDGEEKLNKAKPQLEKKQQALTNLRITINKRLKQHGIPLSYHNGYFQQSTDPTIEKEVEEPFWKLVAESKYENVEKDMLEALDTYDSNGRDPAFYAAKALESMIKIVCKEKLLATGTEKLTAHYINHLNAKDDGPIIINDERTELEALLKIRNNLGAHGPGDEQMPELNDQQALRFIHSAMIWIYTLSKR